MAQYKRRLDYVLITKEFLPFVVVDLFRNANAQHDSEVYWKQWKYYVQHGRVTA